MNPKETLNSGLTLPPDLEMPMGHQKYSLKDKEKCPYFQISEKVKNMPSDPQKGKKNYYLTQFIFLSKAMKKMVKYQKRNKKCQNQDVLSCLLKQRRILDLLILRMHTSEILFILFKKNY